jgi:hypothetical protein
MRAETRVGRHVTWPLLLSDCNQAGMSVHISVNIRNIEFCGYPFSGTWAQWLVRIYTHLVQYKHRQVYSISSWQAFFTRIRSCFSGALGKHNFRLSKQMVSLVESFGYVIVDEE